MSLQIRSVTSPGFAENGYLIWREGRDEAVIADPGSAADELLQTARDENLTVSAILLTHAHIDHVEGLAHVKRETRAPVHLHPADSFLYQAVVQQGAAFGLRIEPLPAVDEELAHGQVLTFGDVSYEVRHVPGHAPGHVMFLLRDAGCALVGDVVFQGSIGRTDLPGGDFTQLIESIRTHVLTLPDDTVLYTGHGPETTVGHERATNPFLIPQYGGGLA